MTADEHLFQWIASDPALVALVGPRIFPLNAPQGDSYPFVRYQAISRSADDAIDEPSALARMRMQIDAYALTYTAARAVQEVLRRRLNGWMPDDGPVRRVTLINQLDRYEGDDVTRIFRSSQDYDVVYTDS